MLTALVEGEADPEMLAELAKGKLRLKRAALEQALAGFVREHHRFLLAQHLTHLDFLDEQVAVFDQQIGQVIARNPENQPAPAPEQAGTPVAKVEPTQPPPLAWEAAVDLLDALPGV